jgi:geranylgeranyl reductase family protein
MTSVAPETGGGQPTVVDEAEVVIVGGGPAGSACAAELASGGHDVLIVDQSPFPRDKPCGDGVTRSAVESLQRLGLDDLLDQSHPVRGLRVLEDYRVREERLYDRGEARCVTRARLDHALLDAATDRGARLRIARVDRVSAGGGMADGVIISAPTGDELILARCVVAADGATSRLRRHAFGRSEHEPRAYAVRVYCRVDQAPDPVYEVFVPLEALGEALIGYGWVFPIEEHLVNVGVGYIRASGLEDPPPIPRVLDSFVRELRERCPERYSTLEPVSKPFGSPVSINFRPEHCELERLAFVGDAARMTDPLTGEGIAYALHGGELVARELHDRLTGVSPSSRPAVPLGLQLARRFPRLGQDVGLPSRMAARTLNDGSDGRRDRPSIDGQRYLESVKRLVGSPDEEPVIVDTCAWRACAAQSPAAVALLDQANAALLDELRTDFPFATELLHREIRSRGGPMTATAMILAYLACSGRPDRFPVRAAVAAELVMLFPMLAGSVTDHPEDKIARLNNSLGVVTLDVVASRALRAMSAEADHLSADFTRATCRMCEGLAVEFQDRFSAERTRDSYLEVVRETTGAVMEFVCRSGAQLAGAAEDAVSALGDYGQELGQLTHTAQDLIELLADSEATGRAAGEPLRHGTYSLALLTALEFDPGLAGRLRPPMGDEALSATLARIRELDCDRQTMEACQVQAQAARAHLDAAGGPAGGLQELVDRQIDELEWLTSPQSPTVLASDSAETLLG